MTSRCATVTALVWTRLPAATAAPVGGAYSCGSRPGAALP